MSRFSYYFFGIFDYLCHALLPVCLGMLLTICAVDIGIWFLIVPVLIFLIFESLSSIYAARDTLETWFGMTIHILGFLFSLLIFASFGNNPFHDFVYGAIESPVFAGGPTGVHRAWVWWIIFAIPAIRLFIIQPIVLIAYKTRAKQNIAEQT